MNAAKQVADKYINNLTVNTGEVQQSATDPVNPYMDMFGSVDLSGYDEVLCGVNIVRAWYYPLCCCCCTIWRLRCWGYERFG